MERLFNQGLAVELNDDETIDTAVEYLLHKHVEALMGRWRRGEPGINIYRDGSRIGLDLPLHLLTKEEVEKNMHEGDTFLSPLETTYLPLVVETHETFERMLVPEGEYL